MFYFSIGNLNWKVPDTEAFIEKNLKLYFEDFLTEVPASVDGIMSAIQNGSLCFQPYDTEISGERFAYYENGWTSWYEGRHVKCNLNLSSMHAVFEYAQKEYVDEISSQFAFPFSTLLARKNGLFMHGAVVVHNGEGIVFTAPSGTGKTTHSDFWVAEFGDEVINGDKALIRIIDDVPMVFGSPWSGSAYVRKNKGVPLKAIVRINQAPYNSVSLINDPTEALHSLASGIYYPYWYDELLDKTMDTFNLLLEGVKVYRLDCLPNVEAAYIARQTIFQDF